MITNYTLEEQAIVNRDWIAVQTFRTYGAAKLIPLCQALSFQEEAPAVFEAFNALLDPWGDCILGKTPQWLSEITYDHTHLELSIALSGEEPELRLLVEPQGKPTTLTSSWETGCQTNH